MITTLVVKEKIVGVEIRVLQQSQVQNGEQVSFCLSLCECVLFAEMVAWVSVTKSLQLSAQGIQVSMSK